MTDNSKRNQVQTSSPICFVPCLDGLRDRLHHTVQFGSSLAFHGRGPTYPPPRESRPNHRQNAETDEAQKLASNHVANAHRYADESEQCGLTDRMRAIKLASVKEPSMKGCKRKQYQFESGQFSRVGIEPKSDDE